MKWSTGSLLFLAMIVAGAACSAPTAAPPAASPKIDLASVARGGLLYSPVTRLFLILELNSVTVMRGEAEIRERVQLYLTPGVSVEPAEGWNLRAGVHLPVTSANEVDSSLIVILTKGF